jgi:tRNA nucleotidyltransferase (CCA-adding enzyme)
LLSYISLWRHVKPRTTGNDLKARGLPPGPRYGEILTRLRAAWLDGEVTDKEQELALLERLL